MTGPRVLVVEDEALIALDVAETLEEAGYTVVGPADRLDTALDLAAREPLDAALLDVNLAGAYVWPVATLLRQRGIAFIVLSGFGNSLEIPEPFRDVMRLGKPFARQALLAALADLCRQ